MTPLPRAAVESPLLGPGQPFSPRVPEAQGEREGRFLDFFVPQNHLVAIDFEAVKRPVSWISSGRRERKGRQSAPCLAWRQSRDSFGSGAFSPGFEQANIESRGDPPSARAVWPGRRPKSAKTEQFAPFLSAAFPGQGPIIRRWTPTPERSL